MDPSQISEIINKLSALSKDLINAYGRYGILDGIYFTIFLIFVVMCLCLIGGLFKVIQNAPKESSDDATAGIGIIMFSILSVFLFIMSLVHLFSFIKWMVAPEAYAISKALSELTLR